MGRKELAVESVAEAYLALLADRGVEYLFANAGTDFAPIVEAYAKAAHTGTPVPKPLLATHENLAMSMAHGYAVASGRVPAVMVHVSVGTANALCGVMNAARTNVPILFTAGRSPLTEEGLAGARDTYIHWAQEMFDQAGMLREAVKWEYELRDGVQLETVIDRALTIATSPPQGPVYLSLPREVLAAPLPGFAYDSPARRVAASAPAPTRPRSTRRRGCSRGRRTRSSSPPMSGATAPAVPALAALAERFAIPVVEHRQRHMNLPADHPCHLGYNPARCSTRPTRSSSSNATCRGSRAAKRRRPIAASSISGWTRCSPAIRSAVSPAMSRSPPPRVRRCRRSPRRWRRSPTLRGNRFAPRPDRRAARRDAGRLAQARRRCQGDAAAQPGLGQRLSCRGARSGLDHRQRIHASARALPVDPARRVFRVEPGGGAGLGRRGGARRQARRTRAAGHRGARRRLVPVREPGRGASRRVAAPPAGAVRRRQ